MAELAREELVTKVKNLLSSGDYSDLVITCGTDIYNVHRAVVCSQSGFFQRAERFAVGKESAEHKVDLPGDDPVIVKLLIQFLYECEYEPKLPNEFGGRIPLIVPVSRSYHYTFPHTCERTGVCDSPNFSNCKHHCCADYTCGHDCRGFICKECTGVSDTSSPDDLLLHAKMYEIADKYDVSGLKILSRDKFSRLCIKYWDDGVFPIALEYALSSTPDKDQGLREVLCRTIVAHTTLLNQAATERIFGEHSTFAYQVTGQLAAKLEGLQSIG